jgi:hypothetical protein
VRHLLPRVLLVSLLGFSVITPLASYQPTEVYSDTILASQTPEPDSLDRYSPEVQQLLLSTYLGHAGQLPDPEEGADILQSYLELMAHETMDQLATQPTALDGRLLQWTAIVRANPASRHAFLGLASVEKLKADATGDEFYRHKAADHYIRAAEIALDHSLVRHTREVSTLLADLNDVGRMNSVFSRILAVARQMTAKDQYIALVDYADGLARTIGGSTRAPKYFEEAIAVNPGNNIEAINKYAKLLLKQNDAKTALALLDRLTPLQRVMHGLPVMLRKRALERLGMDTRSADAEIARIQHDGVPIVGAVPSSGAQQQGEIGAQWAHSYQTDDCRSSVYNAQLWCSDLSGWCYWPYTMNLGEIMYNEARGESVGAQAAVAWTLRNRSGEGVSCDVYVGGVNYTNCRDNLTCSLPPPYDAECPLARAYCCVEHGGTMSPGSSQSQFNDSHVPLPDMEDNGSIFRGFYVLNGWMSDMSSNYTPPGVWNCINTCDSLYCASGSNSYSVGPAGPMEYRAYAFTPYGANVCKYATGFVCANGGANNYFWNRLE